MNDSSGSTSGEGARGHLLLGFAALSLIAVGAVTVTWSGASSAQATGSSTPGDGGGPLDCVNVTHLDRNRGLRLANTFRFGESQPSLQTEYRLADLSDADLRAFCDWEACVSTNGYNHTCWVNDAGWELCRVCDGSADCGDQPTSQDDCVARALAPGRAACHAGLLQECLLQRSMRGPNDHRTTQTCYRSGLACAGELPGDLTEQAQAARHETDQVAVETAVHEMDIAAALVPDAGPLEEGRAQLLASWDGGMPIDVTDDGAVLIEDGGVSPD